MPRPAILVRRILTALAIACLGTWATVKAYAFVSAARNQALLREMAQANAHRSNPGTDVPQPPHQPAREGALIGRIDIPRIHLSAVVLQGASAWLLERAVGHLPGTAFPGETGNTVLAGHRDSFFRGLRHVKAGDSIRLVTPAGTHSYAVATTTIVDPGDTTVLAPTRFPVLTLITCYPFDYVGAAPLRFVVRATGLPSGAETVESALPRFDGRSCAQPRAARLD